MMQTNRPNSILALDVGERRIGVALADVRVRIPAPLATLQRGESTFHEIQELIDKHAVVILVVGLPRGLDGQHTAQTMAVEEFKSNLERTLSIPVRWQDEALTSRKAEEELTERGKPYKKEDIDALSATYILDDFLIDHPEVSL